MSHTLIGELVNTVKILQTTSNHQISVISSVLFLFLWSLAVFFSCVLHFIGGKRVLKITMLRALMNILKWNAKSSSKAAILPRSNRYFGNAVVNYSCANTNVGFWIKCWILELVFLDFFYRCHVICIYISYECVD